MATTFSGRIGPLLFCLLLLGTLFLRHASADDAAPSGGATLNVKDYGAKGDGTTDDTAALNRAFAAAVQAGPGTTLLIPAGTYAVGERTIATPESPRGNLLNVKHADHLTIEGEAGTVILTRNLVKTVFHIEASHHLIVRNFAIDSDPLQFTQGRIIAADPKARTVELQVDAGYDDLDRPDLAAITQFRFFDSPYGADLFSEQQHFPELNGREKLGPGHWRLNFKTPEYQFDSSLVGKKWMIRDTAYRGWAFGVMHSDDVTIDHVQIYECGSGGFELTQNGSVTVDHVTIGPPPNSGRVYAGGGGAMSFFNRGTVTVENCDFSHIDDDGFNLGTRFVRVLAKIDAQTCRTEAWPGDFEAGDTVALWDWDKKEEREIAKIVSAQKEKAGDWIVRFDKPVNFVKMGPGPNLADFHKQLTAQQFDGIDRLADLDSAGSCVLRGNRISSQRARCFLVKAGNAIIEDNVFHDTHMSAILAGPEFFWGEGPELRGLTIRHNTFENVDAPNISVATFDSDAGISNRDVTIEDNTFSDYGRQSVIYLLSGSDPVKYPRGTVIHVRNTDGVTIQNNHIGPAAAGTPAVERIQTEVCKNVKVSQTEGAQ